MARGLFLLLLLVLGQAETGRALACEPPVEAGHTHCPQHDADQGRGTSHDGPTCDAMLSCGASAALPAGASVGVPTARAVAPPVTRLLPPPSRADAPENPPPKA